ncbi:hypothetical protein AB1M95_11345 [Sulfitobacter sp. LCG007]
MRLSICCLALAAMPAAAQEDPMELQRCIWRCLAASPGNSSPEYHQCVEAQCSHLDEGGREAVTQPQSAAPLEAPAGGAATGDDGNRRLDDWTHALASDGQRYFAGAKAKQEGRSFYYICAPEGQSYFAIYGLAIGGAQLSLTIGETAYLVPFDWVNGEYVVPLRADSPLMQALLAEPRKRLWIRDAAGKNLVTLTTRGSTKALKSVLKSCSG